MGVRTPSRTPPGPGAGLRHLGAERTVDARRRWRDMASAARRAAADPASEDAAFDLAGARNAVARLSLPTRGMAGQGAGVALAALAHEWREQGLQRRLMFAEALDAAAGLVERLIEEAALNDAAYGRRVCGGDD